LLFAVTLGARTLWRDCFVRLPSRKIHGLEARATLADRAALDTAGRRLDSCGVGNDSATRNKFRAYLSKSGHKVTGQRLAIFEAAMARTEHFTAEDLLDFAREIDDTVSRATVVWNGSGCCLLIFLKLLRLSF